MIPKFRAWDTTNKEMFKDTFAITESGQVVVVEQEFVTSIPDYVFVDHLVIMQSTGLVDKEGTEVFEGDILHHQIQTEYTFIVKYDKDKGRWYGDGLSRTYQIDITTDFLKFYKVIGNVYENPEVWKNCRRRKNILKNVIKTLEK